jgi:hypothetical protein
MNSIKPFGRKIGVLLLVQMALGLMLPFILLRPPFVNFPDYMTTFGQNPSQVRAAVFIGLVGSALTVAIGIAMWPILSSFSQRLAVALVAVCAISCGLDIVQDGTVMSMLSLSERYLASGGTDAGIYQITGSAVAAARRWAHYTQLIGFAAWMFTFYFAMLRTNLLPRPLAALGMLGVVLQIIGVTLPAFFGFGQIAVLAMILGVIHLATGVWLVAKGFRDPEIGALETSPGI